MLARIEREFPLSAPRVWELLLERDTFLYITRGMLGFTGTQDWPARFSEGVEIETRLRFFNLLPGWSHSLRVVRVDERAKRLESEEHGGPIRRWDHRIVLQPLSEHRCRYIDEIEIEAGALTAFVWAFAQVFYRYRQMRWLRLIARAKSHLTTS
jgi:hypothetical protein